MPPLTLLTLLLLTSPALSQSGSTNILSLIDPLIGTFNGGHVFPGATLPFGMAKAVADVNGEDQGGFASDGSNITGFSHMHDSGTGGVSLREISFCLVRPVFLWWELFCDERLYLTISKALFGAL